LVSAPVALSHIERASYWPNWFTTPPEPGTRAAERFQAAERRHGRELAQQGYAAPVCELLKETFSCEGFDRPSSP
jgi:hypothetical protein